jgi:hypothetical protein
LRRIPSDEHSSGRRSKAVELVEQQALLDVIAAKIRELGEHPDVTSGRSISQVNMLLYIWIRVGSGRRRSDGHLFITTTHEVAHISRETCKYAMTGKVTAHRQPSPLRKSPRNPEFAATDPTQR